MRALAILLLVLGLAALAPAQQTSVLKLRKPPQGTRNWNTLHDQNWDILEGERTRKGTFAARPAANTLTPDALYLVSDCADPLCTAGSGPLQCWTRVDDGGTLWETLACKGPNQICKSLEDPVVGDVFPFHRADGAATISSVDCVTTAPTSAQLTLQTCDGNDTGCTAVNTTPILCTNAGNRSGGLIAPTVGAGAWLRFVVGTVTGTSGKLSTICSGGTNAGTLCPIGNECTGGGVCTLGKLAFCVTFNGIASTSTTVVTTSTSTSSTTSTSTSSTSSSTVTTTTSTSIPTTTSTSVTTTTSSTVTTSTVTGSALPPWNTAAPMVAHWDGNQAGTSKTNTGPCGGTASACNLSTIVSPSTCINGSPSCSDTTTGHFVEGSGALSFDSHACVGGTNAGTLCPVGNECTGGGVCTDHTVAQFAQCSYPACNVLQNLTSFTAGCALRPLDDAGNLTIMDNRRGSANVAGFKLGRLAFGVPVHAMSLVIGSAATFESFSANLEAPTRCAGGSTPGKVCINDGQCGVGACTVHGYTYASVSYDGTTQSVHWNVNGVAAGTATKVCNLAATNTPAKSCANDADCHACVGGTNAGTPCPTGTECTGGGTCGAGTCDAIPVMGAPNGSGFTLSSTTPSSVHDGQLDVCWVAGAVLSDAGQCRIDRCGADGTLCWCNGTAYKDCTTDSACGGAGGLCDLTLRVCSGGSNPGTACPGGTECTGGGTCSQGQCRGRIVGTCAGDVNVGKACLGNGDCPNSVCVPCTPTATCNQSAAS